MTGPLRFHALGGDVEVHAPPGGAAAAAAAARRVFEAYEQRLSRFLPWSELSAFNRSSGTFTASPEFFEVVRLALAYARMTGGMYDPTTLEALEAAGYDRPFSDMPADAAPRATLHATAGAWPALALDDTTRAIARPPGLRIDLGGIAKGYIVDRAIAALGAPAHALVNAAGDLFAAGAGPRGDGWLVGVEDPREPSRDLMVLRVADRGVATSGINRRRWRRGGRLHHHLVDPRTRASSDSGFLSVTVVARNATEADVLAKVIFLLGPGPGIEAAGRFAVATVGVTRDGSIVRTPTIEEYAA